MHAVYVALLLCALFFSLSYIRSFVCCVLFFRLLMFIYLALVMRSQKYNPLNCGVAVQCTSYMRTYTIQSPFIFVLIFRIRLSCTLTGDSVLFLCSSSFFFLIRSSLFFSFCLFWVVFTSFREMKRHCHWFWLLAFGAKSADTGTEFFSHWARKYW